LGSNVTEQRRFVAAQQRPAAATDRDLAIIDQRRDEPEMTL
jgi:hypothetical protein